MVRHMLGAERKSGNTPCRATDYAISKDNEFILPLMPSLRSTRKNTGWQWHCFGLRLYDVAFAPLHADLYQLS